MPSELCFSGPHPGEPGTGDGPRRGPEPTQPLTQPREGVVLGLLSVPSVTQFPSSKEEKQGPHPTQASCFQSSRASSHGARPGGQPSLWRVGFRAGHQGAGAVVDTAGRGHGHGRLGPTMVGAPQERDMCCEGAL